MAAITRAERDEAERYLKVTLKRLDWSTKEDRLVVSMERAQEQYAIAVEKHVAFCAEQDEDPFMGAHGEWQFELEDLYSRIMGRAEDKLEAIKLASDAAKLTNAKLEWSTARCRLDADVDGLIKALESEQIGMESHKSLEKAKDQLEKDVGSLMALGRKILHLAKETNVAEEELEVLSINCVDLMRLLHLILLGLAAS